MKKFEFSLSKPSPSRLALAVAATLLVACAATPMKPDGAAAARDQLSQLQADPDLASRAPLAIKEADAAVRAAEQPQSDPALGAYLVFMADRKVAVARAQAEGHLAVDVRTVLNNQREELRLRARTKEADLANRRANVAQADASDQRMQADEANRRAAVSDADANAQRQNASVEQNRADAAQDATAQAQGESAELRRQIEGMQAKVTDRGLVLTLGDVLFAFDTSTLNAGGTNHLGKLAEFLGKYPKRTAQIEGYTDNVGAQSYNQDLSQRRADAVKRYLVAHGIASDRLDASGMGMNDPIADNTSASGRQQNRRVEVIIDNRVASAQ
jgi:outer membrane protein OmpA-like peptidoglycan-associated protein